VTPVTIGMFALVLGLLVGGSVVVGAPVFAIPIVIVVLLVIGLGQFNRRRHEVGSMEHFREQAATEKVEFTERDRQTTV
jgi:hypothetical protein